MEDLDKLKKEIEKINLHCGDRVCYGHDKAVKKLHTFIRQREKDLLKEVFSRLPSKYDPMTREEMFETIDTLRVTAMTGNLLDIYFRKGKEEELSNE